MRISGGDARGTRLRVPPGARPASERVRQAVFSALGESVSGARVLDLYCGSGAYGLEALSRGAAEATLVDRSTRAVEASRANARTAGFDSSVRVRAMPVERYVRRRAVSDGPFDLVFVDPPYDGFDQAEALLSALSPALAEGTRVVVESRWAPSEVREANGFIVEADRRYGDTRVLTFRRVGER